MNGLKSGAHTREHGSEPHQGLGKSVCRALPAELLIQYVRAGAGSFHFLSITLLP